MYFSRDVAQLVAFLFWEQEVAGSNPVIPKKFREDKKQKNAFSSVGRTEVSKTLCRGFNSYKA